MRKRKVTYPTPKTATTGARNTGFPREAAGTRATVAAIDLGALQGRTDLSVGDRVRIGGGGLYAGEVATVDTLTAGVIPSAVVRTALGRTRRVRVVDLELAPADS